MIYFAFIIKRDYDLTLELVRKLEVNVVEIITLFEELYPRLQIKQLRDQFGLHQDFQPYIWERR